VTIAMTLQRVALSNREIAGSVLTQRRRRCVSPAKGGALGGSIARYGAILMFVAHQLTRL